MAFELFGEMRSSTPEEQELIRKCYEKHAVKIPGPNIFELADMPEGEVVTLDFNIFDSLDKQEVADKDD